MASLNKEKSSIAERLSTGNLVFEELQKLSHRIGEINQELDLKEMRWLELSEIMEI